MSEILIESNSLFTDEELHGRRFGGLLSAVSKARIRTREQFLRSMLSQREGACLDEEAVAAFARNLRSRRYIARVETSVRTRPDSTLSIRVRVWDEWSTLVSVAGVTEPHARIAGIWLSELNFLGQGLNVSAHGFVHRERREYGLEYRADNIGGARVNSIVGVGRSRVGHYAAASFTLPFWSEASPFAADLQVNSDRRWQAWTTGRAEVSHVVMPVADRRASLAATRRWGVPGRLRVLGGELAARTTSLLGDPLAVPHWDFDRAEPAPDSLADVVRRQQVARSHVQAALTVGDRRIRFASVSGLDLVHGVQDVALGTDATITAGRSVSTLAATPSEWYGRIDAYAAGRWSALYAASQARMRVGHRDRSALPGSRWRGIEFDGSSQISGRLPGPGAHVALLRVSGLRSARIDDFFQPRLGGPAGLRGYRDESLPAGSQVVATIEDRLNVPSPHAALDVGTTLFADVGRGWASGVPFGRSTGWMGSVGAGLRFGIPAGSGANFRVEVGWPVSAGRIGPPLLRIYPVELSMRR